MVNIENSLIGLKNSAKRRLKSYTLEYLRTRTIVYMLRFTPLLFHPCVKIHSVQRRADSVSWIISAGSGSGRLHGLVPSAVQDGLDSEGELWVDVTPG